MGLINNINRSVRGIDLLLGKSRTLGATQRPALLQGTKVKLKAFHQL